MYATLLRQVVTNPSTAFEKINSSNYFSFSILIFSISCIIVFFNVYYESSSLISQELPYVTSILYHIANFGGVLLSQILIILMIFLAGKKFGSNADFKRTFSVLSFCVIPTILGALALLSRSFLYSFVFPVDANYDLSPSSVFDFAFSASVIYNLIGIPFLAWSVILYVKAIRVLNDFSVIRSVIFLVAAGLLVLATRSLYDIGSGLLFFH